MERRRHRKKRPEDTNNHDRWLVSYADFITLLFAFFVVMYSISSVNEEKYKRLTESLDSAFSNTDTQTQKSTLNSNPVPIEMPFTAVQPLLLDKPNAPFKPIVLEHQTPAEIEKKRELSEEILKERRQLKKVSDQLEIALGTFVDENLVSVKRNDYWIELEMNSELLFLSGEATLSKKALPVLKEISQVINALPNAVNVEGHTDNIPIDTLKFPSNWDLSSARATSVVQEFVKEGINPTRLSAIGYGEFHPIGDNDVEEGRFKNRRVTLVLMSQAFSRYGANDEERAKLLNLVPTAVSNDTPVSKP
jgi:chemotaxis protein MotB